MGVAQGSVLDLTVLRAVALVGVGSGKVLEREDSWLIEVGPVVKGAEKCAVVSVEDGIVICVDAALEFSVYRQGREDWRVLIVMISDEQNQTKLIHLKKCNITSR